MTGASSRPPAKGFAAWWDRWAYAGYRSDARTLALVRIAYGSYVLLVLGSCVHRLGWVAEIPPAFFDPPLGPMRAFATPPSAGALHLLCLTTYVAAGMVLVGYRTGPSSLVLTLALLLGNGFSYSFGKINHSTVTALVPVLLAAAGWGSIWSADAARRGEGAPRAWPLALLALIVGVAMFGGGLTKLQGSWLDLGSHATRLHMVRHYVAQGHRDLLAPFAMRFGSGFPWEALDWATVTLELGLLPAVLFPRVFRAMLAVFVFFHVGVLLLFNIAFSGQVLVYAGFAPLSRLYGRFAVRGRAPSGSRWPSGTRAAVTGLLLGVLAYMVPAFVREAHVPGGDSVRLADFLWLSSAGALAAAFAWRSIRSPFRGGGPVR